MLKKDSMRLGGRVYAIATFNYMRLLYSLEIYSKWSHRLGNGERKKIAGGGGGVTVKLIKLI